MYYYCCPTYVNTYYFIKACICNAYFPNIGVIIPHGSLTFCLCFNKDIYFTLWRWTGTNICERNNYEQYSCVNRSTRYFFYQRKVKVSKGVSSNRSQAPFVSLTRNLYLGCSEQVVSRDSSVIYISKSCLFLHRNENMFL